MGGDGQDTTPHYTGHRDRLRARFLKAGAEGLQDYELLELILFRAIPRRDVKPLAKKLIGHFGSWSELQDYVRMRLSTEKIEQFRILFLDNKNRLIADEMQQRGTVNHTPVYPREVVKRALELSASAVILVHNHPSGDPKPSKDDVGMTNRIIDAARGVNIRVHDHLIVGKGSVYSFRADGLM